MPDKGLVLIYTGDGKGKTSAALGLCIRNIGWKKKVCIIQFLKSPEFECGEKIFCENNKIPLYTLGIGYSWTKSENEQKECLHRAWKTTKEILYSGEYDLVVLDEIINIFSSSKIDFSDILSENELIKTLENRPVNMSVVLTGRKASEEIIEYADLVSEILEIKHPYTKGVKAQKGIEY